jgi:hypothetical protein
MHVEMWNANKILVGKPEGGEFAVYRYTFIAHV